VSAAPPQYGTAKWVTGVFDEEGNYIADTSEVSWAVFQKASLFGVIVAAVALYLVVSKRRQGRSNAGYEKASV